MQSKKRSGQIKGKFDYGKMGFLTVDLPVVTFEEDGFFHRFSPHLDVVGYGKDEKEAHDSFDTTLKEFFRYTLNKNTFLTEMRRSGWKVRKARPMVAPDFSDLIGKHQYLKEIFNEKRDYQVRNQPIQVPTVA